MLYLYIIHEDFIIFFLSLLSLPPPHLCIFRSFACARYLFILVCCHSFDREIEIFCVFLLCACASGCSSTGSRNSNKNSFHFPGVYALCAFGECIALMTAALRRVHILTFQCLMQKALIENTATAVVAAATILSATWELNVFRKRNVCNAITVFRCPFYLLRSLFFVHHVPFFCWSFIYLP